MNDIEIEGRGVRESYALALREQCAREAKDNLLGYCQFTFPGYEVNWHHREVARHLEAVERGKIDRLIVTLPPRVGKSELTSIRFPAWYFGRNPRRQVIHAAYGDDLVASFGARIRNLAAGEEHRRVFGEGSVPATDARSKSLWITRRGGVYRSAGVGGGVTGFGANLLLIDDPVRGREDADSVIIRNKIWEWYQNDAYTRLMKDGTGSTSGAIVIIATRWHEDDLIGRVLAAGEEDWTVVHYPMVAKDGSVLWPSRYDADTCARIRRSVGVRAWQSLYQGNPIPADGTVFRADWFRASKRSWTPPDAAKGELRVYGASDLALHESAAHDWTVHAVVGVDRNDDVHVLDLWRARSRVEDWTEALLDMAARWKPLMWGFERDLIFKGARPYISKRMQERKVWFAMEELGHMNDKRSKAQAFSARMAAGKVFWPENASWFGDLKTEFLKFDAGRHDDQVDAFSAIGRLIDIMTKGRVVDHRRERAGATGIALAGGDAELPAGMRGLTWGEFLKEAKQGRDTW